MRLLAQMQPKKEIYSISVKTGGKIILVPLSDIAYFEAEDKYVFLSTMDGQKYLTSYTLTTLDEKLPDMFVRVSRSVMVNRHFDGKFVLAMSDKKYEANNGQYLQRCDSATEGVVISGANCNFV